MGNEISIGSEGAGWEAVMEVVVGCELARDRGRRDGGEIERPFEDMDGLRTFEDCSESCMD